MSAYKLIAMKEGKRAVIFASDHGIYHRDNDSPLIQINLSIMTYSGFIDKLKQISQIYNITGEPEISAELFNYFSYSGVRENANNLRAIRGF